MSVIAWILIGLIVGYVSSRFAGRQNEAIFQMSLAVCAALAAGTLFHVVTRNGIIDSSWLTLPIALAAAVLTVATYLTARRTSMAFSYRIVSIPYRPQG